ncbi:hypothetical protein [Pelotomaculum propionicicum]|uniref:Uncharacterized protein n=1 Tax=Pelotomaculum propionicicum TaxID=258475 RepID=A0A4Y7RJY6_9FIRM|nr:hypothetical protein [Pelotomaculum propionicicum]TEB09136.1 hypothetical protein Pmgp_03357 [Pelotomaculum propionicicum]
MPQLVTTDAGQVKVGDVILPGVFESIEVTGSVKLDEVEIEGKEQKVTQAMGYDNARVRLTINLYPEEEDEECYEQIAIYQQIFRSAPNQEKPGLYHIVNKHTYARNINEVIFGDLKTWEDNKGDRVIITCEFIEHVPVAVQIAEETTSEQSTSLSSYSSSSTSSIDESTSEGIDDSWIVDNEEDKTVETPAVDDRKPGLGERILAGLRGE